MMRHLFPIFLFLLLAPSSWAQSESAAAQNITFTKEFPGSQPPYLSLTVREDGEALYRTDPEEKPVEFQLSAGSTQEIFSLARKLDFFRGAKLESQRKVAQMGKKTLAFANGAERADVSFNHTENPDALALTSLFERLSQTQQHLQKLEYLLRFDRLGIVKELLLLEINLDQGRLFEPTLLLPVLEKIQSNRSLVNVAQFRAAQIAGKLQRSKN
jgi:hypothetical protein